MGGPCFDAASMNAQQSTSFAPTEPSALDAPVCGRDAEASPWFIATELQDHLLVSTNDLDRLQRLLDDAGDALLSHFHAAATHLKTALRESGSRSDPDTAALHAAMDQLAGAITSLQFQDMATQLIAHTRRRLRGCADRVAAEALEIDDDGDAFVDTVPMNPNPVTQDEMDAGSIELF